MGSSVAMARPAKASLARSQSGAISSQGERLPQPIRSQVEKRFGFDFGRVRIHTDSASARASEGLRARAFTFGEDIAFAPGQFRPAHPEGARLLAHELAHVVQQSRGGAGEPGLDPASPLEQGAWQAATAFSQASGPVAVAGASAPGIARAWDLQQMQDELDEEYAKPPHFETLGPLHVAAFDTAERKKAVKQAPTFDQIMKQMARQTRIDELKAVRKPPQPKAPEPKAPEPKPPVKVEPPPVAPTAVVSNPVVNIPPGDPQVTPPTSPYVGYMGASNLDLWHINASTALGSSSLGLINTYGLSLGLPKLGPIGLAVAGSRSVDDSGNASTAGYLNPFWAPDDLRLNAGLYLGAAGATGQRPPGVGGTTIGPSGLAAVEGLFGGPSRDQPRLTLGGNLGWTHQPYAQITDPGSAGIPPTSTYLRDTTTWSGAVTAQYNPWYYPYRAAPKARSKTPPLTLFAEAGYSDTSGTVYSGGTSPGAAGSTRSYTLGGGIEGNLRLHDGTTILSGGLYGGYGWRDIKVGQDEDQANGVYGGVFLGGSFR